MFRFLLVLPDGTPPDPAVLLAALPNWRAGEEFMLSNGSEFRILDVNTDMTDDQLEEALRPRHQRHLDGCAPDCRRGGQVWSFD